MKKINTKLFMSGLTALSTMPLMANCATPNTVSTLANSSNELYVPHHSSSVEENGHCTVTYIGKKCSATGCAIIARCTDSSPKAVHLKLQHFNENELANKTIVGELGLRYTMPSHTYEYISCPLSPKTSDDPVWATGKWENNGINSQGVCTSSTLTCYSNPKVLALKDESFITEGVGEELLTTIITPQAGTAREAMVVAGEAIKKYGAQDANIIMATDQNETWMMEIYSRHQYCAVKMPEDKVCVAGNEFILNSLDELGINESNKDEMCILSDNLYGLVKDTDFVKYTDDTKKDVYHLDLFNTYSQPLTWYDEGGEYHETDWAHMRTWRGYSLFDLTDGYEQYASNKKFAPFLTPKDKNGKTRTDMTVEDVMSVYRDEYDDIVDPNSERYNPLFKQKKEEGTLRPIAVQQTRQVHIMSSDASKPKWAAANEWYCPSSGNYTPFLQINNAMTSVDGEFGYYPNRFIFDENCSAVLFRELNRLAWYDRTNYGMPLQSFWKAFESIYFQQMDQVVNEASKLSNVNDARQIITNFNKHVRDVYIDQVKKTKNDLLWFLLDQPAEDPRGYTFVPLIDLESYVKELGWSNYKFDGTKATFERNSTKCEYTISSGTIYAEGTLSVTNGETIKTTELRDNVLENKVYVAFDKLNDAISNYSEIRTININDYLNKFNHLVWVIPTVCVLVIAGGVAAFIIVRNKKKEKAQVNK